MATLEELRVQLDEVDGEIVRLYEKRLRNIVSGYWQK